MGGSNSKPAPVDLLRAFKAEISKPKRDVLIPFRITGYGEKPAIDEAVLHQQITELVRPHGFCVDSCTIRNVDYDNLREEVLRTACLPCDVWFYKPPYDWIAEIRLRTSYVS